MVANVLSRIKEDEEDNNKQCGNLPTISLMPLSLVVPNWIEAVQEEMKQDEYIQALMAQVKEGLLMGIRK